MNRREWSRRIGIALTLALGALSISLLFLPLWAYISEDTTGSMGDAKAASVKVVVMNDDGSWRDLSGLLICRELESEDGALLCEVAR